MLAGDVCAFEQLLTSHSSLLFRYGSKFSTDREFLKDTIQDLFLYVWEHRSALSPTASVRPYLMASLRRMMNRKTSRTPSSDSFNDNHTHFFDVEFSVEQQYIKHESSLLLGDHLKKMLNDLPARQKEVIYLKFYQGLTRDQISMVMDITPQTVSNLLQIAIKQLRHQVNNDFISSYTQLSTLLIICNL